MIGPSWTIKVPLPFIRDTIKTTSAHYSNGLIILNRVKPENFTIGLVDTATILKEPQEDPEDVGIKIELNEELIIVRDLNKVVFGLWVFDELDRTHLCQVLKYCVGEVQELPFASSSSPAAVTKSSTGYAEASTSTNDNDNYNSNTNSNTTDNKTNNTSRRTRRSKNNSGSGSGGGFFDDASLSNANVKSSNSNSNSRGGSGNTGGKRRVTRGGRGSPKQQRSRANTPTPSTGVVYNGRSNTIERNGVSIVADF
ncbi:unnamed protein product [Ambrosiozyma monospora]|uniref:Unnamed protein product n=1 Tax=Ambrosiozyma monospora TaxID=43982 RepID=A0ACB5T6P5_AMBMO|nr:unnamed protein product [Ambrosiozyma monospora]